MSMVSVIVGACISLAVLIASFLSIGDFSVNSGVSPMILAMATFFSLLLGGSLYLALAKVIFPAMYTRTNDLFKHMMLYMVILYICLMPVYLITPGKVDSHAILVPYLIHVMLAIFGLELILGIISQYRYVLLSFYANVAAMILSGAIVFLLYTNASTSGTSLFILIGLSVLMFFLSTFFICTIKFLYYKMYTLTGNDPLGSTFFGIQKEEQEKIDNATNTLLHK